MSRKRSQTEPPPPPFYGLSSLLLTLLCTQELLTEWLSAWPPHQAWLARDTGRGHVPAITLTLTQ